MSEERGMGSHHPCGVQADIGYSALLVGTVLCLKDANDRYVGLGIEFLTFDGMGLERFELKATIVGLLGTVCARVGAELHVTGFFVRGAL
jgi:hypothetical protein